MLSRSGVVTGIFVGLAALYVTLVVAPHPMGLHGGVWSLAANWVVAIVVSRLTPPPSDATILRIHGEVERYVYGEE